MRNYWIPQSVDEAVKSAAKVFYIDRKMAKMWNEHREAGELRLLCGWAWTSKDGKRQRQGFKSMSVCKRDAWYELVKSVPQPVYARPRKKGTMRWTDLPLSIAAAE